MTRKTSRMLTAFLSCSMAVSTLVPFNVLAETLPVEHQESTQTASSRNSEAEKTAAPITMTDFKGDHVSSIEGKVIMNNTGADNFAMSNNVAEIVDDFHYSADVQITDGEAKSAALLVGVANRDKPGDVWRAGNVINHEGTDKMRMFRVPGDHNYQPMQVLEGYDNTQLIHLDLDIKANGDFVYKVISEGGTENIMSGTMDDWAGGYVGILTFNTGAEFSNIQFIDRTVRIDDSTFATTLENLHGLGGVWKYTEEGLNSSGAGDNFAISDTKIKNFEYEGNIRNVGEKGAGALMFRVANPSNPKEGCYVINVDYTHGIFKLFEFPTGGSLAEVPLSSVDPKEDGSYDVKVIAVNEDICVYVNGKGIIKTKDDRHMDGNLGLLTWDGSAIYQNVNHKAADSLPVIEEAKLTDFKLLTEGVTITPAFDPEVKNYGMDIPSGIDKVTVKPESNGTTYITLKDRNGKVTKAKQEVTDTFNLLAEDFDQNFLNMEVTIEKDGFNKSVNFAVNKWLSTAELAAQPYRAQFHVTPQINFMNDPNGMVYDSTDGYWHLFYQYSPNNNFYKQSQAHVRSKDLVNWEQQPLGLQIDEQGLIFSGSAVEDKDNSSGLFTDNKVGESKLVSIYTYHNEKTGKQSQAIATSKDHGKTWTKYAGNPVLDNSHSISGNDFRDPKVFKVDGDASGRWYMITAGGSAQIFTSMDLIHWEKSQALTYKDSDQVIGSECPGLIPVKLNGNGETKWIYNGSAGFYIVGSMKKDANGIYKWTAETDKMPIDSNENPWGGFGKYATMTFFEDGTGQGRQIGISWLQDFIEFEGKTYKGLQSLPQEYGLITDRDGNYVVTSNVVKEVEQLRDMDNVLYQTGKRKVKETDDNILRGVSGIRYDVEGEFTLGTAKEFGFRLRTGGDNELIYKYDVANKKMIVDGRNAGYHVNSGNFSYNLTPLEGNKIKLRIIVDQGAVEAFGNDGEANISTALYQDNANIGMEFFTEGGDVTIDQLHIYDMKSMYSGLSGSESEATQLYLSAPTEAEIDTEFRIAANIYPNVSDAKDIKWSVDKGLSVVREEAGSIVLKGNKEGTYTVKAVAKGMEKEISVKVFKSDFLSNIPAWKVNGKTWKKSASGIIGTNTGGDSFLISDARIFKDQPFIYEADMDIQEGTAAGIVFGVKNKDNPASHWFCANIEYGADKTIAKLFKNTGGEAWADIKEIPSVKAADTDAGDHLKVVYDGKGTLEYWLNGTKIIEHKNADIEDGYIGIQTFKSTTSFNNVKVSYPAAKAVKVMDELKPLIVDFKETGLKDKLATQLHVQMDNSVVLVENVTWKLNGIDTTKPGVYEAEGTIASLTVKQEIVVKADKKKLKASIEKAKSYVQGDYTAESWKQFQQALTAARDVYDNDRATQKETDNAVSILDQAIQKLEKAAVKADKKKLKEVLALATGLKEETYTKESYEAVKKAVANAEKLMADESALQSDVDAAVKKLRTALAGLETVSEIVDKSALEALAETLKGVKKDGYTADSWKVFEEAFHHVQKVLKDENASAEDVFKAYEQLQKAYGGLKIEEVKKDPEQEDQKKEDNKKEDNKKEENGSATKPDSSHPETGDTTSAATAGLLTILAGGFMYVIRRKKKHM